MAWWPLWWQQWWRWLFFTVTGLTKLFGIYNKWRRFLPVWASGTHNSARHGASQSTIVSNMWLIHSGCARLFVGARSQSFEARFPLFLLIYFVTEHLASIRVSVLTSAFNKEKNTESNNADRLPQFSVSLRSLVLGTNGCGGRPLMLAIRLLQYIHLVLKYVYAFYKPVFETDGRLQEEMTYNNKQPLRKRFGNVRWGCVDKIRDCRYAGMEG